MPLFKKYPNLYADIFSPTQINKRHYLAAALKRPELTGRLLYGTDWPLQISPSPWYHFEYLTAADMQFASRQANQWDRDVLPKLALGTPRQVFTKMEEVLGTPQITAPASQLEETVSP